MYEKTLKSEAAGERTTLGRLLEVLQDEYLHGEYFSNIFSNDVHVCNLSNYLTSFEEACNKHRVLTRLPLYASDGR